jgi:hypothetical protein
MDVRMAIRQERRLPQFPGQGVCRDVPTTVAVDVQEISGFEMLWTVRLQVPVRPPSTWSRTMSSVQTWSKASTRSTPWTVSLLPVTSPVKPFSASMTTFPFW